MSKCSYHLKHLVRQLASRKDRLRHSPQGIHWIMFYYYPKPTHRKVRFCFTWKPILPLVNDFTIYLWISSEKRSLKRGQVNSWARAVEFHQVPDSSTFFRSPPNLSPNPRLLILVYSRSTPFERRRKGCANLSRSWVMGIGVNFLLPKAKSLAHILNVTWLGIRNNIFMKSADGVSNRTQGGRNTSQHTKYSWADAHILII